MTITAYPDNAAVVVNGTAVPLDRRAALLELAAVRRDWDVWCVGTVLRYLTPALGDSDRIDWWLAFCAAADEHRALAPRPLGHGRVHDAGSAMQVLDEWHRPYGTDPYAAAMAVADDLDREIDRLVAEAGG